MERLPIELVCLIGESLTSHDLSRLSRTSRTYRGLLEPLLYRLHALGEKRRTGSAVAEAVESADPNQPETRAMSLSILDKVARFCHMEPAALDRCRPTTRASSWLDAGRVGQLSFAYTIWMQVVRCPLSPLHVAALKGLDDIAAWLLGQGANVDAPIRGSKTTALSLAVLGNHVPTALVLLANGADPDLRGSDSNAQDPPTVLHLACALGLAELAEQLLAGQYVEAHPTDLLEFYRRNCPSDVSGLAAAMAQHGADVSQDVFGTFLRASKWQSAWELLTFPLFSNQLTSEGASSMLWDVLCLTGELEKHAEVGVRILRHLLHLGADPDLGRFLWRSSGSVDYATVLKLLPSLLEAGMDTKPARTTGRRGRRKPPAKHGVDDLLGHTSPYDKSQDEEGAAAQLAVVTLLLQHGAPIGGATRGDALDSYPRYPPGPGQQLHGRAGWSYRLCRALLQHCHNTPQDERGEDIEAFLSRFSEMQGRKGGTLVDGL